MTDFADEIEALQRAVQKSELHTPEEWSRMTAAIAEQVERHRRAAIAGAPPLPPLRRSLDWSLPEGVAPSTDPHGHPCCRCSRIADEEERRGRPRTHVAQAERSVNRDTGRVFWLATCTPCTDYEFTDRWNRRYGLATDDAAKERLERERQRWIARGRGYLG